MTDTDKLVEAIISAYDMMYSEFMYCPWCDGHIGWQDERHDDDCISNKIPAIVILREEHRKQWEK